MSGKTAEPEYEVGFDRGMKIGSTSVSLVLGETKRTMFDVIGVQDCLRGRELVITNIEHCSGPPMAGGLSPPSVNSDTNPDCVVVEFSSHNNGRFTVTVKCPSEAIAKFLVASIGKRKKKEHLVPIKECLPMAESGSIKLSPENIVRAVKALSAALSKQESFTKEEAARVLNAEFKVDRHSIVWLRFLTACVKAGKLVRNENGTYRFLKPGETPPPPPPGKDKGAKKFWGSRKQWQEKILIVLKIISQKAGASKTTCDELALALNERFGLQATPASWAQWVRLLVKEELVCHKYGKYWLSEAGFKLIGENQPAGKPAGEASPILDKPATAQKGQSLSVADALDDPLSLLRVTEEIAAENVSLWTAGLQKAQHRLTVIRAKLAKDRQASA